MLIVPALIGLLALGATPAEQQEARDLSRRSIVEYNGGEFEKALADIQRAYDLDPRPGLLFNLAQCHRGLEHWKKAKFAYESYLRQVPDVPNRKAVLKILDEVDEKVRQQDEKEAAVRAAARPPERIQTQVPIVLTAPAAPISAPLVLAPFGEPAPDSGSHKGRTAGWTLGGLGLGAAVVGTVLGVVAQGAFKTVAPPPGDPAGTYYASSYGSFQAGATQAYAADVLWGVGGALVVTGVILLLTSN